MFLRLLSNPLLHPLAIPFLSSRVSRIPTDAPSQRLFPCGLKHTGNLAAVSISPFPRALPVPLQTDFTRVQALGRGRRWPGGRRHLAGVRSHTIELVIGIRVLLRAFEEASDASEKSRPPAPLLRGSVWRRHLLSSRV